MFDRSTIEAYDKHPQAYAALKNSAGFWDTPAGWLRAQVPLPARILEVGTGIGRDIPQFTAYGYEYTGIEPSTGLAAIARENYPQVKIVEADVRTDPLDYTSNHDKYDGLWCMAVLMHLRREELPGALDNLRFLMKSGAAGVIGIKVKPGNPTDGWETRKDIPSPRWYTWWNQTDFAGMLEGHGFGVVDCVHEPGWLIFYVQAS